MIKDILNANENITAATAAENKLKAALPQCFDKDGNFCLAKLQKLLQKDVSADENYELNFLGKSYGRLLQAMETDTVITPDEEHNNLPQNAKSENIYITGDNLDALKHLLKSYENKIKCIYIDPPYNTGSDGFVYNDRFSFTKETLAQKLSISEERAERILELTTRGSASHSAWLTFMYPRLLLARDLLTDDGVIFISIDDNEQANLKLLCDDVFGEQNFVTSLAWQSRKSIQNDTDISINHEYILVYSRKRRQENRRLKESNIKEWYKINSFACMPEALDESKFSNPDNDYRGKWKVDPFDAPNERENLNYAIVNPNTNVKYYPPIGRHWRTEESNFIKLLNDNRILFGVNGDSGPQLKVFYDEKKAYGSVPNTWLSAEEAGTATEATKELQKLFEGKSFFDTPKPTKLINKLLQLAFGTQKNGIMLDFFSGSATTAASVMDYMIANDNKISFIVVQIDDNLDIELANITDKNKKKKYNTIIDFLNSINRLHTLDQIGIERLKRVAAKIKEEHPDTTADLGFKHFRLNQLNSTQLSQIETFSPELNLVGSDDLLQNFGTQTVLATWLNRDGYGLNPAVKAEKLADYTSYICGSHIYLLEKGFDNKALMELCRKYEEDAAFATITSIVVFGYSFSYTELQALQDNVKKFSVTRNSRINVEIRY